MDAQHQELWQRIEAFRLDDPEAALTFSRRLARENGWDHAFAKRVVEEYKRFVFLAMIAGHQVTPSDEVDQAWHLHLTYTRSYWGELCGEVLGQPLHHGPTKGGQQEGERFEDQYEQTLASYRKAFGEEPPVDVWPSSEVRFGEATDFVRVNRQRVWLLSKPSFRHWNTPSLAAACGIVVVPPLAMADDSTFFWIVVGVFVLALIWRVIRGGGGSGGGSGCGGIFFGGDSGCGNSGCGGGGCGGCGGGD